MKAQTEQLIINKAKGICERNYMIYPDFDKDVELTLIDAIAIIITYDEDCNSELIDINVFELLNELNK